METAVWTIIGTTIGIVVSVMIARHFDNRARKLAEATIARANVIIALHRNRHNPNVELKLDNEGQPVGVIVPATGRA